MTRIYPIFEKEILKIDFFKLYKFREDLWLCIDEDIPENPMVFGWFKNVPDEPTENCKWVQMKEIRDFMGDEKVDEILLTRFTIITEDPANDYPNINAVWEKFQNIFYTLR